MEKRCSVKEGRPASRVNLSNRLPLFPESCRKKCTRQSRKVLWVVLSSLFFKEICKKGTRDHGLKFAFAKGKATKVIWTATVSGIVY